MIQKFSKKELQRLGCTGEEIALVLKYQKRFPIILNNEENIEKFCINAKDLYKEIIQSDDTSHVSRWIKRAIKNYGFTENVDFSAISPSGRIGDKSLIAQGGDIKSTTYILSVDTSKQLAMIDKKRIWFYSKKIFYSHGKYCN